MEIKTISTYIFRDHRFWVGLLASVHSAVLVHPCWVLLVDWVPSTRADKEGGVGAQGGGARSLLHTGQAGYISVTHWSLSTLGTTVHFNGSNGTAYTRPLSSDTDSTVNFESKCENNLEWTSCHSGVDLGGKIGFDDLVLLFLQTSVRNIVRHIYATKFTFFANVCMFSFL